MVWSRPPRRCPGADVPCRTRGRCHRRPSAEAAESSSHARAWTGPRGARGRRATCARSGESAAPPDGRPGPRVRPRAAADAACLIRAVIRPAAKIVWMWIPRDGTKNKTRFQSPVYRDSVSSFFTVLLATMHPWRSGAACKFGLNPQHEKEKPASQRSRAQQTTATRRRCEQEAAACHNPLFGSRDQRG